MEPKKVLITGVHGLIAGVVYKRLTEAPGRYEVYGLARRRQPSERVAEGGAVDIPEERFHLADLSDFEAVKRAVEGMAVVVHMAADASGRQGFQSILPNNIKGAYHVFEACRLAGVKRVIFASSNQVCHGYRRKEPYGAIYDGRFEDVPEDIPMVTHESPTWPQNLYAGSKVWGESLARAYAHRHDMSCICLRIGWVVAEDRPPRPTGTWCSQRDIAQLVERCIDAPESVRFDIFYGVSDNRYRWVDIEHARETIGYAPQDRGEDFA